MRHGAIWEVSTESTRSHWSESLGCSAAAETSVARVKAAGSQRGMGAWLYWSRGSG